MNEQMPYVVENKWLVYASNTMEATMIYRNEIDPNKWPSVRQAKLEELSRLIPLLPTPVRRAG
ncbi:MAG: hypothetical protein K8U57_28680 [Planctomycetes bacterium]|nr:hypothetical protein [Planctomycetota bacterium]